MHGIVCVGFGTGKKINQFFDSVILGFLLQINCCNIMRKGSEKDERQSGGAIFVSFLPASTTSGFACKLQHFGLAVHKPETGKPQNP